MLCGSSFGLRVRRHRKFWSNVPFFAMSCDHRTQGPVLDVTGEGAPKGARKFANGTEDSSDAMGIDWMNRRELSQAIPPAYTEFIGQQLLQHLSSAAPVEGGE
jgi:DNA (cytosine-5)-methyltransferase 1